MYPGILDPIGGGPGLDHLYVSLGNVCNARCDYCDVHDQPAGERLDAGLVDRVLEEAAALGVRRVHFMGGGEPLISARFDSAISTCRRMGLSIVLTSNGSHLLQRLEGPLGEAALEAVFISLDSHVAEVHDRVRGVPGLFARAREGIRACGLRHPDAKIVLNHVLTARNVDHVDSFLSFAAAVRARAVNLIPVKDRSLLSPRAHQLVALSLRMGHLRETALKHNMLLLCEDDVVAHWVEQRVQRQHSSPPQRQFRCFFPRHALYVDFATGDTFPCDCTVHRPGPFEVGNIRRDSLEAMWNGASIGRLRDVLESTDDPGCKMDCDWNNIRSNRLIGGRSHGRPGG